MKKTEIILSSVLAISLSACGGGGSDSGTANAEAAYSGKKDLAQINSSNIEIFSDLLLLNISQETGTVLRSPEHTTKSSAHTPKHLQDKLLTTSEKLALRQQFANRTEESTEQCPTGGTLKTTGNADESTKTGTLTLQFNNCSGIDGDSTILTGKTVITINAYNAVLEEPTALITEFHGITGEAYDGTKTTLTGVVSENSNVSGSVVISTNTQSKIHAAVNGSNLDYQYLSDLQSVYTTSSNSYNISGSIYDEDHGKANVSTTQQLIYGIDADIPSVGEIVMTGANASQLKLTGGYSKPAAGPGFFRALDADGDGAFEYNDKILTTAQ